LGGAYFLEALTEELEEKARALISRIDELGGAVAAIEQGFVQAEIEASAYRHQADVESGDRVVVGVNAFAGDAREKVELLQVDPAIERRQCERTVRVRSSRDATAATSTLDEVRRVAATEANLLPALRDALAAHCTVGEICGVLRDLWGTYDTRA
ncbi:MAG TPA: methylmalonyl-CoA mutase family protein, partial [Gaiellaceae bacterium]|nr:methylmalonyl-CoA mutase family protein [Gaiellaceae bacterium]